MDATVQSIVRRTAPPKSLRATSPVRGKVEKYGHVANKRLRTELARTSENNARAKELLEDAEWLQTGEAGLLQAEGELERTWRVAQAEISDATGIAAAVGRKELKLDGGPYRSRYTRNGR